MSVHAGFHGINDFLSSTIFAFSSSDLHTLLAWSSPIVIRVFPSPISSAKIPPNVTLAFGISKLIPPLKGLKKNSVPSSRRYWPQRGDNSLGFLLGFSYKLWKEVLPSR